jgi:acyl-CoA synthetase (AMP-forming)/AMP-acid ligase II
MTTTVLSRLNSDDLAAFTAGGQWGKHTIYGLVHSHAEVAPDKVAVRERWRTVTYRALVNAADRLAGVLARAGLKAGDRIAVWLPSRAETAAVLLACSRDGYVCVPSLHRDHSVDEVMELLRRMRARAAVVQRGYGADAARRDIFDALPTLDSMRSVIALDAPDETGSGIEAFGDPGLPAVDREPRTDPNSIVYLAFTSGTTGQPKGVMHSDNTLLAPVRALQSDWSLDDRMVIYSLSPLSHNLGFGAMVLALTGGGELVVHDLPRTASLADRLAETGATFAFGVPTHAIDLLSELRVSVRELTALQGFRISGASVPPSVVEGLLAVGVMPQSGYGMTEAGSHHYTLPTDSPEDIAGTSGRPYAGYEVAVFSDDDPAAVVPPGEVGQIGARGPSLMLGYFDDQFMTESSFNADGWFMTGDMGVIDERGYLRITGRKKDIIVRGGHNIYPARVESLAVRHEAIDKVSAVPFPDARLGEKLCLVVAFKPGRSAPAEEILCHLDAEGLSLSDMPEYFATVAHMPLLSSGKIAKRELVRLVDEGALSPVAVRFQPRGVA